MTRAPVRVRFAPAPTGYLHIGGARTALFNWLFARQQGGELKLRIEDTDAERSKRELIEIIYRALEWLGIDWDGEPVHQSDRAELYREATEKLLASGHAYWCSCTPEEVKARAEARGGKPGYDGHCRDRGLGPGSRHVVRFRTPDEGTTAFDDVIRGHISFENHDLEDFVIVRSNGVPMFLVANAVDDAEMGITHVIRGEDLINVTPKVLLLRQALGIGEVPVFAHLPLIVNERRQKLSKRRDDVSVGDYIERGYLPEAMANYLATLGWGPPDGVEIRPMVEIIELFDLASVNKASAFFDLKKLDHFNGEYIRALTTTEFVNRSTHWVTGGRAAWPAERFDASVFERLAPEVQTRVTKLDEVPSYVAFAFVDTPPFDEDSWQKAMAKNPEQAAAMLDAVIGAYADLPWEAEALMAAIADHGSRLGLPKKQWQAPVRVALTGRTVGLPLGLILEVLGRDETLRRLRAARDRL
ncbi:glutamate--tRNA ligase [Rhabdothermincola sediminis]|uniref:glutamate--tRNA ligase n=1 Tax=Rhabdothermincola sediminis TaxID=2751370 RepID=UPI001AA0468E|nr:glutamate--tRNA ligase [Rhabdothermincola sediminis]